MDTSKALGMELARQVCLLAALHDEKKALNADLKAREEAIKREIMRLSHDIRTGQTSLYSGEKERG